MMRKLWPARTAKQNDGPVADLDAIIAEPVPFRFKGRIHHLNPVDLKDFLKFANAQDALMKAAGDPNVKLTARGLAERYHAVLSPLCDSISVEDVESMEQVQIAALYQLIIDMVTGQVDMGEGKKKRTKIRDMYAIAQASSSPSAPANSDGQPPQH